MSERSLPEEGLTERAVRLVGGIEPLADATNMELVATVLARQLGQTAVGSVQRAVANAAVLDAVHLLVDVLLPKKDRRDNVTVTRLNQVAD